MFHDTPSLLWYYSAEKQNVWVTLPFTSLILTFHAKKMFLEILKLFSSDVIYHFFSQVALKMVPDKIDLQLQHHNFKNMSLVDVIHCPAYIVNLFLFLGNTGRKLKLLNCGYPPCTRNRKTQRKLQTSRNRMRKSGFLVSSPFV